MSSRGPLASGEWLEVFSRIGDGVRRAVLPITGTEAGRAPLSVGAGGDTTLELDRAAEAVVFAELAGLGERGRGNGDGSEADAVHRHAVPDGDFPRQVARVYHEPGTGRGRADLGEGAEPFNDSREHSR